MGEVWVAEHRLLARPAAIKLLRQSDLGSRDPLQMEQLRQRFQREAGATTALRSPHTVGLKPAGDVTPRTAATD